MFKLTVAADLITQLCADMPGLVQDDSSLSKLDNHAN